LMMTAVAGLCLGAVGIFAYKRFATPESTMIAEAPAPEIAASIGSSAPATSLENIAVPSAEDTTALSVVEPSEGILPVAQPVEEEIEFDFGDLEQAESLPRFLNETDKPEPADTSLLNQDDPLLSSSLSNDDELLDEDNVAIQSDDLPPWRKYAVSPPLVGDKAVLSIMVDTRGAELEIVDKFLDLKIPFTFILDSSTPDIQLLAAKIRDSGSEVLLSMPMGTATNVDPGENAILSGLAPDEIRRRARWHMAKLEGYVGVTNHLGDKATSDATTMRSLMEELKEQGVIFVDSRTSTTSVAGAVARRAGIPAGDLEVKLDQNVSKKRIGQRLALAKMRATQWGALIAVTSAHAKGLQSIKDWNKKQDETSTVILTPLTTVIKKLRTANN